MKPISDLSPEQLKSVAIILQQSSLIVSSHVKATHALAQFEMDVANDEKAIYITPENEEKTRKMLRESVKFAAQNLKLVGGLV